MELVRILETLWRRRRWVVASILVSAFAGTAAAYHVSFFPPTLKGKSFQVGAATTQVLLDSPRSSLVVLDQDLERLSTRAAVFALFARSGPLTDAIADKAGIPRSRLTTEGPQLGGGTDVNKEIDAEPRANQLVAEGKLYRLRFDGGEGQETPLPIVGITAQAPTAPEAVKVADAAASALSEYVDRTAAATGAPPAERLRIQQMGPAAGGVIAHDIARKTIALTFLVVLMCLLVLIVVMSGVIESWRREKAAVRDDELLGAARMNGAGNGVMPDLPAKTQV